MTATPEPRRGMPSPRLSEAEFRARFMTRYVDPTFDAARTLLEGVQAKRPAG